LRIVEEDPSRVSKLTAPLDVLSKYWADFRPADAVQSALNDIGIDNEKAKPLLHLIAYLPISACAELLERLREIATIENSLLETSKLLYETAPLSEVPDDIFERVAGMYKRGMSDDSYFAIYIPFAAVNSDYDIFSEILEPGSEIRFILAINRNLIRFNLITESVILTVSVHQVGVITDYYSDSISTSGVQYLNMKVQQCHLR
jgi:hypothetical protein